MTNQQAFETGAINVNGRWATSVHFQAERHPNGQRTVQLRFTNASGPIGSARLSEEDAQQLLGERNMARISKAIADQPEATTISGSLRGSYLAYRGQISLPEQDDNVISQRTRVRRAKPAAAPDPAPKQTIQAEPESASSAPVIPESIAKRFVRVDNRYYFPDHSLAFTDHGARLKAETNNTEVVRGLVAIAQTRGWEAITVSGADQFRREIWRQASRAGIEVTGYRPTEIEKAALRRDLEQPQRAQPTEPPGSPPPEQQRQQPAHRHPSPPHEQITGRLLEAGPAHYRFDPAQGQSFYAKLRTAQGERTLWGVDLERALAESKTQVRVGDTVTVENRGAQPVTVKVPERDAAGQLVGDKSITTHRNAWLIEKPEYFEQRRQRAEAFREQALPRQQLVERHPDLTSAVISLWLGEQFADKRLQHPEDKQRMVALVKDRLTHALERGEPIQAPLLKQEVAQRLDEFARRPAPQHARDRIPEEPQPTR